MFVDKNCAYGIVKGGVLHRNKTEGNENNTEFNTSTRLKTPVKATRQLKNTP